MSKHEKVGAEVLEKEAAFLEDEAAQLEQQAKSIEDRAHELEHKAHELEAEARRERQEEAEHGHNEHSHGDDHGHGHEEGHGDHDHGDHGGHTHLVEITMVVNGQPIVLQAAEGETLASVRHRALTDTQNLAQPPENWEIKNEAGAVLDPEKHVGEYHFGPKVTLFLSLKAGAAGAAGR